MHPRATCVSSIRPTYLGLRRRSFSSARDPVLSLGFLTALTSSQYPHSFAHSRRITRTRTMGKRRNSFVASDGEDPGDERPAKVSKKATKATKASKPSGGAQVDSDGNTFWEVSTPARHQVPRVADSGPSQDLQQAPGRRREVQGQHLCQPARVLRG